jgi:hypothetical protein
MKEAPKDGLDYEHMHSGKAFEMGGESVGYY